MYPGPRKATRFEVASVAGAGGKAQEEEAAAAVPEAGRVAKARHASSSSA